MAAPPDPGSTFAQQAAQLNALARQILAAKDAGDSVTLAALTSQYKTLLGRFTPEQKAATVAQLQRDMPSDFLTRLAGLGDTFTNLLKYAAIGGAVYLGLKLVRK